MNSIQPKDVPLSLGYVQLVIPRVSLDIDIFIIRQLNKHIPPSTITKLKLKTYGRVISEKSINQYRDNLEYSILKETYSLLEGTPIARVRLVCCK